MVICSWSLQLVDISFLPFDASAKSNFDEFKKFLVVTSRRVLLREEGVDESQ